MQTFLAFVLLLAFCVLGLEVKVFFSKKRRFPETEIGRSEEMRKRGVTCIREDELDRHGRARRQPTDSPTACRGCSLAEACRKIES
ncbi:MAG: hypothetical protein LBH84_03485 [Prevotellaceae bacterium]|jgi:hypothetical protein|nr:hypothetical protein [Prevotellaceae bacterium]